MNYVGSSPTTEIFLYVAQTVERVVAVDFGKELCSSPTIGIFIYIGHAVERVLAIALGNELY